MGDQRANIDSTKTNLTDIIGGSQGEFWGAYFWGKHRGTFPKFPKITKIFLKDIDLLSLNM